MMPKTDPSGTLTIYKQCETNGLALGKNEHSVLMSHHFKKI